jgi:hypothetical protein
MALADSEIRGQICGRAPGSDLVDGLLDKVKLGGCVGADDTACHATLYVTQGNGSTDSSTSSSNRDDFRRLGEVGFVGSMTGVDVLMKSRNEVGSGVSWEGHFD